MHIWDVETTVEKEKHKVALEVENTSTRAEVEQQRTLAKQPGTEEHRELAEINANIERFNVQRRTEGHKRQHGFKRKRVAEQVWKFQDIQRGQKNTSIDWFLYREKVLVSKLYDYYKKAQYKHPDVEVWLVEDNAGEHTKASDVKEKYQKDHRILKAPHPPNSPDLNMIEELWDYEKDRVEEYPMYSGTEEDVEKVKAYVIRK